MRVSDGAIKNRTTVLVLVVLIVVVGAYSYITLPRESAPDVPIPYVLVTTVYEGVAPQDIETQVTMKLEEKLTGLKGMKEVRSTSTEGMSIVIVEFEPDVVIEDALQRVRDKVDLAKGDLPIDVKPSVIQEINIAEMPIMMVHLSAAGSQVQLKQIADGLQDRIEAIPGVLSVDILGALEREIRVEIDPDRLTAYNFTLAELLALIPGENRNISAGGLETKGLRFNVRLPAEFDDPEEMSNLLLTTRNGRPIYLHEVAKIHDTFQDRPGYARLDNRPAVSLSIQKRVGANIVDIADNVKAILAEARKRVPTDVRLDITMDRSEDISLMVSDLENNVLSGLILVVGVLMVFLGLRTSLVVALAIPLSMLMSFAIIQALGYTLNMIVLFSLILALGMLVDDAIVIVENIYRHRRQLGMGRIEAARKGTAEVAWPVITSTLTTLAGFLPLIFWPGIMGSFMKYLPITLIVTLSSSLFVALVVSPVVCTMVSLGEGKPPRESRFMNGYRQFLAFAIEHRAAALALSGLLLVALGVAYAKFGRGVEFFPEVDPKHAIINVRLPQGTNVKETDRVARLLEQRVEKYRPWLKRMVTNVGGSSEAAISFGESSNGPHVVNLTLVFPDYEQRQRLSADVVKDLRNDLTDLAGGEIKVQKEQHGPPTGAPVTVRVAGDDFKTLVRLSEEVKKRIETVPNLVNLRSDFEGRRPELVFIPDRRKITLQGINTAAIGNFLKTAVFGWDVSKYRQFNDEYDITVRLPESRRTNVEDLFQLRVPNARGYAVPLSELGHFEFRPGLGDIHRVAQKRVVTVTADNEGRPGPEVLQDARKRLDGMELPSGYSISYAGEKEEQDKASLFLGRAFIIALLLITGILVAQFNTLSVPMIIMSTVLLSLIGVLGGLLVHHLYFSIIMTGIGVISLAGVVVKNGIVLLDYTRQLQRQGMDVIAASVRAGATRLRPVLLTAATTVLGLIPTAIGVSFDFRTMHFATRSESSQWWQNMATVVIYGLTFATILTLVVVPTAYVMVYRLASRLGLGGLNKPGSELEKQAPEYENY